MQARRAARELALLTLFQAEQVFKIQAGADASESSEAAACQLPPAPELQRLMLDAVRSLSQSAEDSLETTAAQFVKLREMALEHQMNDPANTHTPVDAALVPVPMPKTDAFIADLDACLNALNQLGHALAMPELAMHAAHEDVQQYALKLVQLAIKNQDALDEKITAFSQDWRLDRILAMDKTLLRLALAEILYIADVDAAVTINETLELAKLYATPESPKFINGVLGGVVRALTVV
ncbi:MAG: transcription antitermination factor NusB [Vampirovibrionales bacterium]|nr:transcription antitermination factor NusB [Vampirovibrionales bacterium]